MPTDRIALRLKCFLGILCAFSSMNASLLAILFELSHSVTFSDKTRIIRVDDIIIFFISL